MKRKIYKNHLLFGILGFPVFTNEVISNFIRLLSVNRREEQFSYNSATRYPEEV